MTTIYRFQYLQDKNGYLAYRQFVRLILHILGKRNWNFLPTLIKEACPSEQYCGSMKSSIFMKYEINILKIHLHLFIFLNISNPIYDLLPQRSSIHVYIFPMVQSTYESVIWSRNKLAHFIGNEDPIALVHRLTSLGKVRNLSHFPFLLSCYNRMQ